MFYAAGSSLTFAIRFGVVKGLILECINTQNVYMIHFNVLLRNVHLLEAHGVYIGNTVDFYLN